MAEIIRQDYRGLLVPDKNDTSIMKIDYIALTEWAYRKHFIQQAITIIESKMPRVLVDMGILYYCSADSNIRNKVLRLLSKELKAYEHNGDWPSRLISYRGEIIPVFIDDYGQQLFTFIRGEEHTGGSFNLFAEEEFMYEMDLVLEREFLEGVRDDI
jgi:hypothetical protein